MAYSLLIFIVQSVAIISALFYTQKIRPKISIVIVCVSIIGLPAILCFLYVVNWVGLIYFVVSVTSVFYFYTKQLRVLLDVFLLLIASIVSKTILQYIEINLFSLLHSEYLFFAEGSVIANGISTMLFLLFFVCFTYLYQMFVQKTWNSIAIPVISQVLLITIAFITVTVLSMNLFISLSDNLYYPAIFNLFMQIVYFLIMFILFVFLLRNTKKQNLLKQKEAEQEQLFQYMQALEKVNKDMQGFRHDYKNILLTMQGYLNADDMKGLKAYFNNRIVKVENRTMQNNYIFNQLDNIELIELKGMLSTKVLLAEEWGINMNVEVPESIQRIQMDIIDLTRIVGILMDNAIEACAEIKDKQLNVALLKTMHSSILIILENSVNSESIQIESLFTADYSTKGESHGMGLATVRTILNTYPNITMNTRIENGLFIHEIEINDVSIQRNSSAFQPKKMA